MNENYEKRRCFISVPMRGRTREEIETDVLRASAWIKAHGLEPVRPFVEEITPCSPNPALFFLSESLLRMSACQDAFFCANSGQYRGCRLEHDAAIAYGLGVYLEDDAKTSVMYERAILD